LNSTSPLFTAVIAHYLTTDDKLTSNRLLGIVIGMFGVSILIGPDALRGLGSQVIAQLAMLGATCSYGFAAVYGRQFKGTPPAVSAAGMLAGATILTLPLAALEQPWTLSPSLQSLGAILGLSFLSTALAFIIWFQLIFRAGASNTSMVTFLIPITALTLGILFLHEEIVATSIIGLMTILGGLAVAQNRWFKRFLSIK
ncbi:MAG: DMT family transporter, partial [Anaerolineae bacterium]|nr:DMT family transporter [Anaerolineae bacterium]